MMVFHGDGEEGWCEHVRAVESPDQRVRLRHCLANNREEEARDPRPGGRRREASCQGHALL